MPTVCGKRKFRAASPTSILERQGPSPGRQSNGVSPQDSITASDAQKILAVARCVRILVAHALLPVWVLRTSLNRWHTGGLQNHTAKSGCATYFSLPHLPPRA